jgi:nitrile hydratase
MVKRPRDLLRDAFDLHLPEDVSLEVWDSNSEIRYMVLPGRPPGTEDLTEAELADLVTRDAMIGVDRLVGGDDS